MAVLVDALLAAVQKPTLVEAAAELAALAAPLWIAAILGVFIGWAWRPRWAAGLAAAAEPSAPPPVPDQTVGVVAEPAPVLENPAAVGEEDLRHLVRLVEETDGGPAWRKMLERSLPMMNYEAWQRDPPSGPPQYRSSTIFEDATPEIVRDFFWDDEFRTENGWDDMLLEHTTLESCPTTGAMMVLWVRKFPFFCSNREYIIGRRIWESKGTFYCVTKGVPCSSVPRRNKPRRVDLYYSSWCIRPVASKIDGRMTACEVLLFHHEDMGIPWELAKLGVKQGMWGCVKKIEPGLRAYQTARRSEVPAKSPSSAMAEITTTFDADKLRSLEDNPSCSSTDIIEMEKQKHWASNLPKFLVVGGALALACTLDQGLLTKAVIFGVARRFSRQGK